MKRVIVSLLLGMSFIFAQDSVLQQIERETSALIKQVTPSVVQVRCEVEPVSSREISQEIERRFHVGKHLWSEEEIKVKEDNLSDSGLGVILDTSGHILTGSFVNNAKKIEVVLSDGRILPAKLSGVDERTQIAVIEIKGDGLIPAQMGNSDLAVAGTMILAIGTPYGMGRHVFLGNVSAAPLVINGQARMPISVPVYPGDKGGPIFNLRGELIGLIDGVLRHPQKGEKKHKFKLKLKIPEFKNKKFSKKMEKFEKQMQQLEKQMKGLGKEIKEQVEVFADETDIPKIVKEFSPGLPFGRQERENKLGLAVPINVLKPAIDDLLAWGTVKRGWLGVRVSAISPALKAHLPTLKGRFGVQVDEVFPGSPAQKAGIDKWDIIVEFAGAPVKSIAHFQSMVERSTGQVSIMIVRGAVEVEINAEIAPRKD